MVEDREAIEELERDSPLDGQEYCAAGEFCWTERLLHREEERGKFRESISGAASRR
jgi:hypothetical protein